MRDRTSSREFGCEVVGQEVCVGVRSGGGSRGVFEVREGVVGGGGKNCVIYHLWVGDPTRIERKGMSCGSSGGGWTNTESRSSVVDGGRGCGGTGRE